MTKSVAKTIKKDEISFQFPQFDMTAFKGNPLSAYASGGQAYFENAVAWNKEIVRFANERLRANIQRFQDLSTCTSWEEAVTVQADFFRAAADAYLAEMPKLVEQMTRSVATASESKSHSSQAATKA